MPLLSLLFAARQQPTPSCAVHLHPSSPRRRGPSASRLFSTVMPANVGIHGRCLRCCSCSRQGCTTKRLVRHEASDSASTPPLHTRRPHEGGDPVTHALSVPSCPRTRASMDVALAVAVVSARATARAFRALSRPRPFSLLAQRKGPKRKGLPRRIYSSRPDTARGSAHSASCLGCRRRASCAPPLRGLTIAAGGQKFRWLRNDSSRPAHIRNAPLPPSFPRRREPSDFPLNKNRQARQRAQA